MKQLFLTPTFFLDCIISVVYTDNTNLSFREVLLIKSEVVC